MTEDISITDLFSMSKPVKTDSQTLERELKLLGIRSPNLCFQCSKCTSGCEAMKLLELEPHSVMASVKAGFVQETVGLDVLWACVGCYKCKERCPQGVSPVEVMYVLKNWYVASGSPIPGDYQTLLQNMMTRGFIHEEKEVPDDMNGSKGRRSFGLPEIKGPRDMERFAMLLSSIIVDKL
jgi:heterodisulfide reductase subunit C